MTNAPRWSWTILLSPESIRDAIARLPPPPEWRPVRFVGAHDVVDAIPINNEPAILTHALFMGIPWRTAPLSAGSVFVEEENRAGERRWRRLAGRAT